MRSTQQNPNNTFGDTNRCVTVFQCSSGSLRQERVHRFLVDAGLRQQPATTTTATTKGHQGQKERLIKRRHRRQRRARHRPKGFRGEGGGSADADRRRPSAVLGRRQHGGVEQLAPDAPAPPVRLAIRTSAPAGCVVRAAVGRRRRWRRFRQHVPDAEAARLRIAAHHSFLCHRSFTFVLGRLTSLLLFLYFSL